MNQYCEFKTERLFVKDWLYKNEEVVEKLAFTKKVINILSPRVTEALPDGWQNINTTEQANQWIFERAKEGFFLTVWLKSKPELLGFLFLYECESENQSLDLRFGYLLAESAWGKGFGTELINGLVDWCKKRDYIQSLSGGVERNNIGSIKVMEKTGFSISAESKPTNDVIFYEQKFR
ncbi:GNAT family N-acetyltransferase [Marinifilum sp. D714]|uniref:GNAT family N-acetyltransferase n=1 Tax=Marinifilum sp. D714 TaxID=2937523 RepID=UPI0027CCE798|nr:GNAT family N-acetyltransferase [Marinifilum sp. D714]MDQ2180785.1 GNAT family N-acetyltransferase [Marinifilum sp. D714]